MIVLTETQRTPEWYTAKTGLISASNMHLVIGNDTAERRKYLNRLALERMTGVYIEGFTTDAMQNGIDLERAAKLMVELKTGLAIDDFGLAKHDTLPIGASLDGDVTAVAAVWEGKAPTLQVHSYYLETLKVPKNYYIQMQTQMMVRGYSIGLFSSYCPDEKLPPNARLLLLEVEADEKTQALIAEKAVAFDKAINERVELWQNFKQPDLAFIQNYKGGK